MTLSELKTAVLLELQVIAAGETPAGEDSDTVGDSYTTYHAELVNDEKATWNVDDDIPDSVGDPMVLLLAYRLSRGFGKNEQFRSALYVDALMPQNPHNAHRRLSAALNRANDVNSTPRTTF